MAQRTLPGLGLTAYYPTGYEGWGDPLSNDLRLLSVIARGEAKSRATPIPGTGSAGDVYIVPSDAMSEANKIAVWDGPAGLEAWVYIAPMTGLKFSLADESGLFEYRDGAWSNVLASTTGARHHIAGGVYGELTDGLEVFRAIAGSDMRVNINAGVSFLRCDVAPSGAAAVFAIKHVTAAGVSTTLGTATIADGQTAATFSASETMPYNIPRGDEVRCSVTTASGAEGAHATVWGDLQ